MNRQGEVATITGRYMCSLCGKTTIVNAGELLPACPSCKKDETAWSLVTDLSWVSPNRSNAQHKRES